MTEESDPVNHYLIKNRRD